MNRLFSLGSSLIACSMGVVGCAAETEATPISGLPERPLFEAPAVFAIAPDASQAGFADWPMPIAEGRFQVSSADATSLRVDALEIDVHDLVLAEDAPILEGTGLKDIRVRAAEPVTATVQKSGAGDAGTASFSLDLYIDWSLLTNDGKTVPLAPLTISGVDVELSVYRRASGVTEADLQGGKSGMIVEVASLMALKDLSFSLFATETETTPPPIL